MVRLGFRRILHSFARTYRRLARPETPEAHSLTLEHLAADLSNLKVVTDEVALRLARTDELHLSLARLHDVLSATRSDVSNTQSELQQIVARRFDEPSLAVLYALSEKLDLLHGKFDQAPWLALYGLSEKIDILLHARNAADRTDLHVSREVDRLDGYLNYHADQIQQTIEKEVSEQIRESIEYLSLPVLISISEKIDAVSQRMIELEIKNPK